MVLPTAKAPVALVVKLTVYFTPAVFAVAGVTETVGLETLAALAAVAPTVAKRPSARATVANTALRRRRTSDVLIDASPCLAGPALRTKPSPLLGSWFPPTG
jgi:hypothetical protein